jgi:2'-5' RNA ligase
MDQIRAFIAVEIFDSIKKEIVKSTKALDVPGIKPLPAEQLHITLFFLGNIDEKKQHEIEAVLSGMEKKAFDVSFKGVGAFTPQNPRIIYAKIEEPGASKLIGLYNALNDLIIGTGIKLEERSFTPHVTIARVKKPGKEGIVTDFLKKNQELSFGSFTCKEIKLIKSTLTEEGPVYEPLYSRSLL